MSEVFYKVLEMSLYGSIAILAVLLFRLVFTKCPKRVLILFWIIVGLRLIYEFAVNVYVSFFVNVDGIAGKGYDTLDKQFILPGDTTELACPVIPGMKKDQDITVRKRRLHAVS